MTSACKVPIVWCVYNRPDFTRQTFAVLRSVKPMRLLIVADGPNAEKPDDRIRCDEVQRIIQAIDWEVNVDINLAPANLGCRKRIQTGLTWAFDQVNEAIVIEDDCIPDPSFFPFCEQLLNRYETDRGVGLICGTNFQFGNDTGPESYYFSRYPLLWGWAAWRRTWDLYDADLTAWDRLRPTSWLADTLTDVLPTAYWRAIFDSVRSGLDTWDYSLVFSCWRNQLLSVQPRCNLVRNIGFGADSTHTDAGQSIFSNMPTKPMSFPLTHPHHVERNDSCDLRTERVAFSGTLRQRIRTARNLVSRPELK